MKKEKTPEQLIDENQELRIRLQEAEETLQAIREGAVDAVVVEGRKGVRVFTLTGEEQVYRLMVETMGEAGLTTTPQGKILFCNRQFSQMLRLPMEEIIGQDLQKFVKESDRRKSAALLVKAQVKPLRRRLVFRTGGGAAVPAWVSANRLDYNDSVSICLVAMDQTELEASKEAMRQIVEQRKELTGQQEKLMTQREELAVQQEELQAQNEELLAMNEQLVATEAELRKLNRMLRAVINSNQAMMHARDEQEILANTCRIIVEDCGYSMAWIGFAEHDEAKSVRPAAFFGLEEGFLETTKFSWADTPRGRGPSGTAIRTGKVSMCKHILTDPRFKPWRKEAMKRGYMSSIALPLMEGTKTFGALVVYSKEPDPFSDDEARLLTELANDLAYGIFALRARDAKEKAERELAADLSALTRMHSLSTRILEEDTLEPLLQEIIDTAVAIVGADKGTLQLLEGQRLRIVAHHGHEEPFLRFFASAENVASVCGEATRQGQRVVVEDVEQSPIFAGAESLNVLRNAGVRAAQSTPLLCRRGRLLGVLTTQWAVPHAPDEHDLWRLDLLVRQTSDLIEQRNVDEALHQSEDRLSLALGVSQLGTWDLDLINHAAWRTLRHDEIFGYDSLLPEWTYEMFLEHILPEDRERVSHCFNEAIAGGHDWQFECRIRRTDGQVRWIWARGHSYPDANGKPARMLGVVGDITERQKYEEQLRRINQELERSNADLQQFAYVASHDLREPLRAINGFMDLLRRRCKDTLDEKANEYIDYAASGAKRMDALLTGLLAYSRVQTQGKPRTPVSAQAALNAAVENLRADIDESNAAISSDPLPSVNADGMQFTQLLQNLIHNALKFRTGQRPEIHVGCTNHDNGWLFCVRDNGIGIEPQFRERIFTIFHRVNPQDKRSGYGVGLSICKKIVERHNGRIWVESEPGKGSTFYFTIPD